MLRFLLILAVCLIANSLTLQILSISSSKSSVQAPIYSSLKGGRMIYINVVGHSLLPSENLVKTGQYPCVIPPGGIAENMIMCETTDTNSTVDINNLPLTLTSLGQSATTSRPNLINFQNAFTSTIADVYPTAAYSTGKVSFFGNSRTNNYGSSIRDLGDLVSLKIGNDICSTFDIAQNSQTSFHCKITPHQEAGKYNVSAHFTWGKASKNRTFQTGTLNSNEYYQFTVVPTVTSVSPAWGNYGGRNLTIRGTGFSLHPNSNKVIVDNTPCRVTFASQTQIECTLAARDYSQPPTYVSGAGLQYARYSFKTSNSIASVVDLMNAVRQNSSALLSGLQQKGIRLDMREPDLYGSFNGQTWKGFFTAITTGNYTFRASSDDFYYWFLATSPRSMVLPQTPFISSAFFQRTESFYLSDIPTAENTVYLEAGQSYYLEIYQINYGGPSYFRAVVEVPNNDTTLPHQTYQIDYLQTNSTDQTTIIGGSFDLTILGVQLKNLPYNVDALTLQAKIREIKGLENTQVYQISARGFQYGSRWVIQYVGYFDRINAIPNGTNLSGSRSTVAVTVRRRYSSNILFDPIDYRLLRTNSTKANAMVTVNDVPSVCAGNCSYSFIDYASISKITLSGATLNLAINDKLNKGFILSDLRITVDGLECLKNVAPSPNIISSFSCNIQKNTDGTPIISAGQFTPTIQIKDYGYVGLDFGVYPINIPLVVTSISPTTGITNGGYNLSIVGKGFPLQSYRVKVYICNKTAEIVSLGNQNMIVSVPPCNSSGVFPVNITVNQVFNSDSKFTYTSGVASRIIPINGSATTISRWSDLSTWGSNGFPYDGDTVVVPAGFTLLIDRSTPKLEGIKADNSTIIISNQTDITIKTFYFKITGGKLQAGTELAPHPKNITIIIHNQVANQSLKYLKGITCLQCRIYLFGVSTTSWTTLSNSIVKGSSNFTTSEDMNWKVGDTIVVTSTGLSHYESQMRTIVQATNRNYTVDQPFSYSHISTIQIYSEKELEMRAEVALISKSISITGSADSSDKKDGASLFVLGKSINGLQVQIQNVKFSNCGQPLLGKACIQFELNSDLPTSYLKNNSIVEGYSRAIGLRSSNNITISNNVIYRVRGHGIYLQNGVQTNNALIRNLVISTINATYLQHMDLFAASFWITHPTNFIENNRAAGSDGTGFWYQTKESPDGPYIPGAICPSGNPLGSAANNTAHSNMRSALRIYKLSSRSTPCVPIRNDSNLDDPFTDNPSISAVFSNWTIFKNGEDGLYAEETGNVIVQNCRFAQNYQNAIQFPLANFTREPWKISNSLIVGLSQTNQEAYSNLLMTGVTTARSGNSQLSNLSFYSYPAGTTVIQTCAGCDDILQFTNAGSQIWVQRLQFNKIDGNYLKMLGLKRDIIYDKDGCLSTLFDGSNRKNGTIVSYFPHLDSNKCTASTTNKWGNTRVCNESITIRRITFTNLNQASLFYGQLMKISEIGSIDQGIGLTTPYSTVSSQLNNNEPRVQSPSSWTAPFITGRIYMIWWGIGFDFSRLSIKSTSSFSQEDKAVILKFNNTESRELYRVGPIIGGVLPNLSTFRVASLAPLNSVTCSNGEYFFNNSLSNRMLTVCQSGKNRSYFELTNISPIKCQYLCQVSSLGTSKENFIRFWSNASQWPFGRVPEENESVLIRSQWTMILDIDPAPLNSLVIDGTLIIEDTRDFVIFADSITVRTGSLLAGNSTIPFTHKLTILIQGSQQHGMVNNLPINQYLLVTGSMRLYGVSPPSVTTYLTQPIAVGSNRLFVESASGWRIDDLISISLNSTDYEAVYIQSINADGSINVAPNFKYSYPLSNTVLVKHLTRNIKIVADSSTEIGFSIIITSFSNNSHNIKGNMVLDSVEIVNGGQLSNNLPALLFKNVDLSSLAKTTFINCLDLCIRYEKSTNITYANNNVVFNPFKSASQHNSSSSESNITNPTSSIAIESQYPQNRDRNLYIVIIFGGVLVGISLLGLIIKMTCQRQSHRISNQQLYRQSQLKKPPSQPNTDAQMIANTQPKEQ